MRHFLLAAIILLVAACTPSKKESEEQPSLKDQVMDVHDEVMPKMGELRATQKELLAMADSSAADSVMSAKYTELANDIKLANESMMDWMRQFDPAFSGTDEEVKAYLEEQLKDIETVKSNMEGSLKEGKKALGK